MSALQLTVVLVAVLCLLNTIAVVALTRQVGVLHLRIQPVAGMSGGGGPEYGTELTLPGKISDLVQRDAERFLVGFVSPTCGLCGAVTTAFGQIAKSARADTALLLVVDASVAEAHTYLRSNGVEFIPHIADKSSFTTNVPGAPWVVVTDATGAVIVSGGVNTLDNVEEMLSQADMLIANPPVAVIAQNEPVDQAEETRAHVV